MPQATTDDASLLDIAIVGCSCRLPGAPSIDALWRLLVDGRCAVTAIPPDRWALPRAKHPRAAEPGRSYSWAAGILDDVWGFDAAAFGISPREAEQMDPQQRLLLELTWEALEDAGMKPSAMAGSETGVFVGGSAVDHATLRMIDMAAADAYMMTGNTLSILSNRLSYIFDLHGPSYTVDTACSSSLVAVAEAVANLRAGRIETAIVGGVSLLLAPQAFIGFSQATMLSRRGLCQAFSSQADGYVRGEGGVVLVLKTRAAALRAGDPIHGFIVASEVNSDGRTNGIALPSQTYQAQLLERVYLDRGIDPDDLAFVEAHGTGTPIGDPVEAAALGAILGRNRTAPLPIGSLKTNIGHLEAAAGLSGLLKAMLALKHGILPRSLHCEDPNPAIDFEALNLRVARDEVRLTHATATRRLAGVNAFGFGGTNAHVVLAEPPRRASPVVSSAPTGFLPTCLLLTAHSHDALAALAASYAVRLDGVDEAGARRLAGAAAHRRDRLPHRLAIPFGGKRDVIGPLARFAAGDASAFARGTAVGRAVPVAFVFSGNASQFAGMGRAAFARNAVFRARVEAISDAFAALAGWSIAAMLHADDLDAKLRRTRIAQPLLFAIQSAACHTLRHLGLRPDMVLGHSVGEIAAAEAAGILDIDAALRVLFARSRHQELAFEQGGMAVVIGTRRAADAIVDDLPGLEIAAINSPRAFTVSGSEAAMSRLAPVARRHEARVLALDLAYPFHGPGVAPVEAPLLRDLDTLRPSRAHTPFISTVTGAALDGTICDAAYWWRNVREPVRFADAVATAAQAGARVFVEIGPQATLLSHIGDTLSEREGPIATLAAMEKRDAGGDPLVAAVATALVRGAKVDDDTLFGAGSRSDAIVSLPLYPWQRKPYRLPESHESPGLVRPVAWHPLIGARIRADQLEWRADLDTLLHPWFADHRVEGRVILPGAAFVEMALAVARDWSGHEQTRVVELEISRPMTLADDAPLEIACRLSPVARHLEILSRPRRFGGPWQSHATAKILQDAAISAPNADTHSQPPRRTIAGPAFYAVADRVGLAFGPAFRQLERATLSGEQIHVDLSPGDADPAFGLDPARLDACFHALLAVFADARGTSDPVACIPVRVGEIALLQPGAPIVAATIDIRRHSPRGLVADVAVRDAAGGIVALLREIRFQAIRAVPRPAPTCVRERWMLASAPTACRADPVASLTTLRRAAVGAQPAAAIAEHDVLLDGWATSLSLHIARSLATDGVLDPDAVVAAGRWPRRLEPWLAGVLHTLSRSGLSRGGPLGHHVDRDAELPSPHAILAAIVREHPALSAEAMAACAAGVAVDSLLAGVAVADSASLAKAMTTVEHGSAQARAAAATLGDLLRAFAATWPKDRAMRILLIGQGPLLGPVLALAEATRARLTICEPDRRRHELLRLQLAARADIALSARAEDLEAGACDLVVAAGTLRRCVPDTAAWRTIVRAMAPDAIFAAIEPTPSFFRDFVFGLETHPAGTAARTSDTRSWTATLRAAGLASVAVDAIEAGGDAALLLTARAEKRDPRHHDGGGPMVVVGSSGHDATARALVTALAAAGERAVLAEGASLPLGGGSPSLIVLVAGDRRGTPAAAIRAHCRRLAQLAGDVGQREARLWIIVSGVEDVAAAVLAFARTLANEFPMLDVRRVEVTAHLAAEGLAARLRDLILAGGVETEIVVAPDATYLRRFETVAIEALDRGRPAQAAQLAFGEGAGFDRLRWAAVSHPAPGPGDIEIEVAAVGVNFRDVMFGLGLLPDDMLEHGFAGPSLGLECAGRVVRVGKGVERFAPGDRVMAFARDAFATHVTTPAALVAPVPEAMTLEAAAGVPVAFLTAFYGLIEQARLKPGEWVLIHGGAGGVGLAALQIALWRGAKVIATAGTPEKRELLRVLGAAHVFDSRSGAFVDDVRRVTGEGVAVALNSLAGEAMERTIQLLRPFGRFVELGKRDYVGNTHVGLRPFRRNLSYFGVDLDQLLVGDPAMARRLMRRVMRLVEDDVLLPLPYRVFEAAETADAFRLMQGAGHIGKLVLRPPDPALMRLRPSSAGWQAAADKVHLVTGGLGGFGLATAEWLADRGARHLLLVGRNGLAEPAARKLAALAARGVRVRIEALDVADTGATRRLFARFGRDLPPLAGIVHAAMVLDDALVANLTDEAMKRVLRPKATGAAALDRLTRNMPLDYFILYSSATTLVGNPGQAAYVAANGYLEGLARRRRRAGLPGLAVSWGAIADVGVVARSDATRELLETRAGVVAVPARAALDQLGEVLALADGDPAQAVVALASMDWAVARRHLSVLRGPAYAALAGPEREVGETGKLDIAALVAAQTPEAARRQIGGLIVDEIARVLRLPREEVPRTVPLSEIGLDSLMAVELALGLETRFALDRPLSATASGFSVNELADHVIGVAGGRPERPDARSRDVLARHLGPETLDAAE